MYPDAFDGFPFPDPVASSSTAVSLTSLYRALFTRRRRLPLVFRSPYSLIQPEDMNAAYLTGTTLILTAEPSIGLVEEAQPTTAVQPTARQIAVTLAAFLNVSLQTLGGMCGIGRTTFTTWHTKNPRVGTVRDLYRMNSVLTALRSAIGDERTRAWLRSGEPSPFMFLEVGDISAVERLASPLLFSLNESSPSLAVSDVTLSDLPRPSPSERAPVGRKRPVRSRQKFDA